MPHFATPDLTSIGPEIVITLGAILILGLDLVVPRDSRPYLAWLGVITAILAGISAAGLWGRTGYPFEGSMVIDNFRVAFDLIILLGCAITLMMSTAYLHREDLDHGEFYALTLFAALGMMLMAGGMDLMVIFLGLETLSIAFYILAAFARTRAESNEAGLKYLLIGSFATAFLLYGIALVYGATGSTNLFNIDQFLQHSSIVGDKLLMAGIALLVVGFGFKVAAFPFHVWTPDVYEGAPTPVTAYMATGVKAAAFAAFARVFIIGLGSQHAAWTPMIFWLSILTMTVGNVVASVQTNIKRMLAYSSIAHAGYLLIALVAGTDEAMAALVYYALAYTLMTIGAFAVVAYLGHKGEPNLSVYDYAGLGFRYPWTGAAMTLFMLSLAGIPPTAGFFAKFLLFKAAIHYSLSLVPLVVIAVINSVISLYYYLSPVVQMYMHRPEEGEAGVAPARATGLALAISGIGVLLVGILPNLVLIAVERSYLLAMK